MPISQQSESIWIMVELMHDGSRWMDIDFRFRSRSQINEAFTKLFTDYLHFNPFIPNAKGALGTNE